MQLKVLLPSMVFLDIAGVLRMNVPTIAGYVGIYPQRLDFVSAIAPGIMDWQNADGENLYTALDGGVMSKTGNQVLCSVHNAATDSDPAKLQDIIEKQFLALNTQQQAVRLTLSKLESSLLLRLRRFQLE